MKRVMFALLMGTMVFGCNAQDGGKLENEDQAKDTLTVREPRGRWKVDREVDENGNIVRYDSIYSYSYGSMDSIPFEMDLDSIMKGIPFFSNGNLSSFMSEQNLGHIFEPDSLLQGNRVFEDFFERQRGDNFSDMKQFMQQMDSLQRTIMGKDGQFRAGTGEQRSKI